VVELLGISAEGRTLDETRERLESAARGYLEFNQESVRRRLEPSSASTRTETFTVDL
jgi:predicted RNase H-like HicB family nuclease